MEISAALSALWLGKDFTTLLYCLKTTGKLSGSTKNDWKIVVVVVAFVAAAAVAVVVVVVTIVIIILVVTVIVVEVFGLDRP